MNIRLIAVDEASPALARLRWSEQDQTWQEMCEDIIRAICRTFGVSEQELGVVTVVDSYLVEPNVLQIAQKSSGSCSSLFLEPLV